MAHHHENKRTKCNILKLSEWIICGLFPYPYQWAFLTLSLSHSPSRDLFHSLPISFCAFIFIYAACGSAISSLYILLFCSKLRMEAKTKRLLTLSRHIHVLNCVTKCVKTYTENGSVLPIKLSRLIINQMENTTPQQMRVLFSISTAFKFFTNEVLFQHIFQKTSFFFFQFTDPAITVFVNFIAEMECIMLPKEYHSTKSSGTMWMEFSVKRTLYTLDA